MALTPLWRRLTGLDCAIVLLLLLATVFAFSLLGDNGAGERVVVEQDGRILFRAPLAERRTVAFSGPLGFTEVAIEDGGARILASPCPHKDCMAMGTARRHGDFLACVPNRLLVRIEGGSGAAADHDLVSH
jgi:hypothetical protein